MSLDAFCLLLMTDLMPCRLLVVTSFGTTNFKASFRLETECPNWKKVDVILGGKDLDVMKELFTNKQTGTLDSQVLDISFKTIPHVSCPVISGILKALEVSVGLALPKNAAITFIK